jgi:uncharacterized repeat protein (TIGR01451 family)
LAFVDSNNFILLQADVVSQDQTLLFTLPSIALSNIGNLEIGDVFVDNRGKWRVIGTSVSDGSTLVSASFSVSDPQQTVSNLAVDKFLVGENLVAAGGLISFTLSVTNHGPDTASDVELTDAVPANTTFVSGTQGAGPAFTCTNPTEGTTGTTTCTIASLAPGAVAEFSFVYQVNAGTPVGTIIENTANLTSTTTERHTPDNTGTAAARVSAGVAPATCALDCPNNITVQANATQSGNSGAFVTFSSAEGVGECGEITTNTPSGSFFPVGTTSVQVSSSAGGGSCSFSVTVVTSGAPTITCPSDQTVTAEANASEATVNPGTPTTSPATGVSVSGLRSDNQALNAPYPVGLTVITWRVTDSVGLTSTCTQRITVNSESCGTDTDPPTITAPANITIATPPDTTGSCGLVIGESQLGIADAADNCIVNVTRAGVPSGNFFPVGVTTITYTATDGAGLTATASQVITVTDGTAPRIAAPADANYVCPSEVPAANPSQATRGEVLDENGNLLPPGPPSDNCGTPVVTVSETSTGAGSAGNPLVITRTFTATDAAGNSASSTQTITVADPESPTISAPADASYQCASEIPGANAADATAADNCGAPNVTVTESNNGGAGTSASPLIITRSFTATDAGGNSQSDSQTITVIDTIAPTVSAPADASYQCASNVPGASPSDATASDNCGATPGVTVSESNNGGAGSTSSPLIITRVYTATDDHGNSASDSQTITVIDDTPPAVSCPANIVSYLPLDSTATSMAVSFAAPTATDNCSTPTVSTNVASGAVFPVGTTTVTATATDDKGNSSSCTFTVTVRYNFTGFFSPVINPPTLNSVNAGRAIPLKFSLSGNKGLDIFAAAYPASQQIACDSSAPLSELDGTETSGGSTLTYSPDTYHYSWKTEASWAGTCRQLVVRLNDGTDHIALFKFK